MQNIYSYRPVFNSNDTLIHYGVKGMKWDESKKRGNVLENYKRIKDDARAYRGRIAWETELKKERAEATRNNEAFKKTQRDNNYKSIVQTAGQIQNRIKEIANNPVSKFINNHIVPKSKILKGIQEAANKLNASFRSGELRIALIKKGVDV